MDAVIDLDVDMHELTRKAGQRLAELCGAEAALITSGASGAMTLQAAACIAGTDPARVHSLPDTRGMKAEIPIYKGHRIRYDQAWRKAGATLVEYGDMRDCSAWELEKAISPETAAVAYMVGPTLPRAALPLETVCETARGRGLPVIVDAAAMLPPRANLRRYLDQGADMVAFSGGKGLRGPQGTGILLGRADLIEAAIANTSPNHGVGRSGKVAKEEMLGLLTAVEVFLEQDEEAEFARWYRQGRYIADVLAELPGLRATVENDGMEWVTPTAVVQLGRDWKGPSRAQIAARLKEGDPPIFIGQAPTPGALFVKTINLSDADVELVASRLLEVLTGPA
jgi:L-seryl-tRNA(Ser) seleniumtransferase